MRPEGQPIVIFVIGSIGRGEYVGSDIPNERVTRYHGPEDQRGLLIETPESLSQRRAGDLDHPLEWSGDQENRARKRQRTDEQGHDTVTLGRASKPKLPKMKASQQTSMTRNARSVARVLRPFWGCKGPRP